MQSWYSLVIFGWLLLAACGGTSGDTDSDTDGAVELDGSTAEDETSEDSKTAVEDALTYYEHIKPILDDKCSLCHVPRGVAPFPLTTYDEAKIWAPQIKVEVNAGRMPPWFAVDGCNHYVGDRSLSRKQKKQIAKWVDDGALEGDPDDAPKAIPRDEPTFEASVALKMPEEYTPEITPDEYRCFLLPWPEDELTYITGIGFRPGNEAMVHHTVLYSVSPSSYETVKARDDEDPGPGYTCFTGSAGGPGVSLIGAIEKSEAGRMFPDDLGMPMEPGSYVLMQQHYNTLQTGGPEPDRSTVEFATKRQLARPARASWFMNGLWPLGNMPIPAGNDHVVHEYRAGLLSTLTGPVALHWADLHMHQLGTSGELSVIRADGSTECLLRIDDWDFDWQETYMFVDEVVVNPGDQVYLRCEFDNSADNQIIVDGERLEPQDVNWGDRSQDEMCLGNFLISELEGAASEDDGEPAAEDPDDDGM